MLCVNSSYLEYVEICLARISLSVASSRCVTETARIHIQNPNRLLAVHSWNPLLSRVFCVSSEKLLVLRMFVLDCNEFLHSGM